MTITCPTTGERVIIDPAPPPKEDGKIEFDCPGCGAPHVGRLMTVSQSVSLTTPDEET